MMSLADREPEPLSSQQALANIAALAQIDEVQHQLQQHPLPTFQQHQQQAQPYQQQQQQLQPFQRQFSFPPERFVPPPTFGRCQQSLTSAYGSGWKGGQTSGYYLLYLNNITSAFYV
jgi:hypothetical protein